MHAIDTRTMTENRNSASRAREKGVVLPIALIVLVAMTLSALSLVRSVNTTNLISGNLAFRESALLSSEHGAETALVDLLIPGSAAGSATLHADAAGYWARRADPAAGETWETFWDSLSARKTPAPIVTGETDVAGNTVSYVVHRLCEEAGPPAVAKCSEPPLTSHDDSKDTGKDPLAKSKQVYYRITSRVLGPRNTVVYTQTLVAI
jgi:Tfp pilus assembly protein PilX